MLAGIKKRIPSLTRLPKYVLRKSVLSSNKSNINHVVHVVENVDWVIRWIGETIKENLTGEDFSFDIEASSFFVTDSIVHFGSLHTIFREAWVTKEPSNRSMVTVFHGNKDTDAYFSEAIDNFLKIQDSVDRVVVSNSIMRDRMINWGVKEEKLKLIPIGVHFDTFQNCTEKKEDLRKEFGIPDDAVCIGSFQKDGSGWGDGMEPKLIKGPDVFVDVVSEISKTKKVHVLLTGPSRGFVKKGLEDHGIPFTHHLLDRPEKVARYYRALDLYLVTSREEGGPQAIMEAMASGTPLVSSRMGMAVDVIQDGVNAMIAEVEDVGGFVKKSMELLDHPEKTREILSSAVNDVKAYDWAPICRQYGDLYKELMALPPKSK